MPAHSKQYCGRLASATGPVGQLAAPHTECSLNAAHRVSLRTLSSGRAAPSCPPPLVFFHFPSRSAMAVWCSDFGAPQDVSRRLECRHVAPARRGAGAAGDTGHVVLIFVGVEARCIRCTPSRKSVKVIWRSRRPWALEDDHWWKSFLTRAAVAGDRRRNAWRAGTSSS